MNEKTVAYCISCAREFRPQSPDVLLCPDCGGPPEPAAHASASAGKTILDVSNPALEAGQTISETQPAFEPPARTPAGPSEGRSFSESEVPAEWHPGDELLDTYVVSGLLGEGGMGKVYRVHHKSWNIDLAVKSPRPEFFQTQDQRDLFIAEAETWVNLGLHPHIVSCYYVRILGGIPRVFAELVEGGSLADWIEQRKITTLEQALDIAIQFAWGLAYAHEQGLVHRDVKPANVLMTPDGTVKVTDFGLVKAGKGMTPAYASPEQAEAQIKNVELTQKTDIWSWGLSVLEIFAGRAFWVRPEMPEYAWGQVAAQALDHYVAGDINEVLITNMPAGLAQLLSECFQGNPGDRPSNIGQLADRLVSAYKTQTGQVYQLKQPQAANLRADSLNNMALSYLDLEKKNEAVSSWNDALKIDPHHVETTFNLGLLRWIHAQQTDLELVQQLEAVSATHNNSWMPKFLLGLIHTRRQDVPAAKQALEEALKLNPGDNQIQIAIRNLENIPPVVCVRTLEGWNKLEGMAITPDWHVVASVGSDKRLEIWDLEAGKCLYASPIGANSVNAIATSPDGRLAITGESDNTLRLWDLTTYRCLGTMRGHTKEVTSLAISKDGRQVISGSNDWTVRVWDLESGECLHTLRDQYEGVASVAITSDGQRAVAGYYNGRLNVWDLNSGSCLYTMEGHKAWVSALAITPDGQRAVSGSNDTTLRVWDLESGECLRTLQGHTAWVSALAITPDGRFVISGSWDCTLRVWDLATGRCLYTLIGHTRQVNALAIPRKEGILIFSSSADNTIRIWQIVFINQNIPLWALNRPPSVQRLQEADVKVLKQLDAARLALRDGQISQAATILFEALQTPGYERDARLLELWHAAGRQAGVPGKLRMVHLQRKLQNQSSNLITDLAITPDGRLAVYSGDWFTVQVWNLENGERLQTLQGHTNLVSSLAITPDGRLVVSGSYDTTLRIWDLTSGKCQRILQGHTAQIETIAVSPDGKRIVSGDWNGTLRVWDLETGVCLRTLQGHTEWATAVAFTPNGCQVVSGSDDRTLRIWDLASGTCLHTLKGHIGKILALAITPDGHQIISGGFDKIMRVWDLESGACLRTLQGHTDWVSTIKISANGGKVVSGGGDRTLRVWDLFTSECLYTLEGHASTSGVNALDITSDGRQVVSGSDDKTLLIWSLDWDFEFPEPADWDERALPYLRNFLTLHTPFSGAPPQNREPTEEEISLALTRCGTPTWSEADFQGLLLSLGPRGFGWLRPDGVRRKLEEMTQACNSPQVTSHFCLICGKEFQTIDPDEVFCPDHADQKPTLESGYLEDVLAPVTLPPDLSKTPESVERKLYRSEPSAAWLTINSMRAFHDVDSLIRVLTRSPDINIRRAAACALGILCDKRAYPVLRQTMQDPDDLIKFHSACGLARLGDFQIMMQFLGEERPPFLPGIEMQKFDPWDWVKPYGSAAVENVLNELREPLNFEFLKIGADFIIQYEDYAMVPVLWGCLQHEDYRIRAVAAHKLGSLPDADSCERLIPLLGDEVNVVADRAADALRMIGKTALPALKKFNDVAISSRVLELIAQIEAAD